jgi:hypothetical protein
MLHKTLKQHAKHSATQTRNDQTTLRRLQEQVFTMKTISSQTDVLQRVGQSSISGSEYQSIVDQSIVVRPPSHRRSFIRNSALTISHGIVKRNVLKLHQVHYATVCTSSSLTSLLKMRTIELLHSSPPSRKSSLRR